MKSKLAFTGLALSLVFFALTGCTQSSASVGNTDTIIQLNESNIAQVDSAKLLAMNDAIPRIETEMAKQYAKDPAHFSQADMARGGMIQQNRHLINRELRQREIHISVAAQKAAGLTQSCIRLRNPQPWSYCAPMSSDTRHKIGEPLLKQGWWEKTKGGTIDHNSEEWKALGVAFRKIVQENYPGTLPQ